MSQSSTLLKALLLAFAAFCLPVSLRAAEIDLEPRIGFHGLFHLGHPFPLRIDLTNLGPPVEGMLEVKIWKGRASKGIGLYPIYYKKELLLSAQSRKSVSFTLDPDSLSRPLVMTFSSPGISLTKEVDLRRHFSPQPLNLLLTENSVSPPIPLASGSANPLITLSAAQLPSDARAYGGVATVIIYEQSLRDLSRAQAAALESWLSSGGRIVVLGSMHYALYQEPSMSRFLPVRVVGLKRFSSLPGLQKLYGKLSSPRDLWAQDSRLVEGRILIGEEGNPILVEMARGRGKVFYLSLDVGRPPVSRWEGLSLLFKDLLATVPERGSPPEAAWDEGVFSQLLSNRLFISAYMPIRSLLLWTLFYFSGLGLLAWLWQQQRLRRRMLVFSFLSFLVFCSLAGHLHFARGGNMPDGVLLSATLLESLPDGYAEALSNVALFSTRGRRHDLKIERGWRDFELVPRRLGGSDDGALEVQEEADGTQMGFLLREWDYRLLKVRSMALFPLRAELEKEGDKISLKLANPTNYDLTGCWLVISSQAFFLGDLLRGSSQLREFHLARERPYAAAGQSNKAGLREVSYSDKAREILFRYSFFPSDQIARWSGGTALFFGWVENAPRRVWSDDARILPYGYTLFRALLPVGEEEE